MAAQKAICNMLLLCIMLWRLRTVVRRSTSVAVATSMTTPLNEAWSRQAAYMPIYVSAILVIIVAADCQARASESILSVLLIRLKISISASPSQPPRMAQVRYFCLFFVIACIKCPVVCTA